MKEWTKSKGRRGENRNYVNLGKLQNHALAIPNNGEFNYKVEKVVWKISES